MSEEREAGHEPQHSDYSFDSFSRVRDVAAKLLDRIYGERSGRTSLGDSSRAFAAGDCLDGRYQIVRYVAQGGAGQVYEAEDLELGGRVALKVLHPELAADETRLNQFRQEVLLARQVTHPNVCRLFDLGHHRSDNQPDQPDQLFVTMEWIPGHTLSEYLRGQGSLSETEAVQIMLQVAEGVAEAHRQNVTHRDIKGSNVMLTPCDQHGTRAIVMDFGLARRSEGVSSPADRGDSFVVAGTPMYMAPEQRDGFSVGPRADIYALGVLCYHLLTGQWPRSSVSSGSDGALRSGTSSSHIINLDISESLAQLLRRCLASDPQERFCDAAELLTALRKCRDDRQPKTSRAKRAVALGLIALAVCVSGLWYWLRPAPALPSVYLGSLTPQGGQAEPWVGTAVIQGLESYLISGETVRVTRASDSIDAGAIDALLNQGDADSMNRLAAALGTQWLLRGSYVNDEAGRIRLELELVALDATRMSDRIQVDGLTTGLWDLTSRAAGDLLIRFGVRGPNARQAATAAAEQPEDMQARRLLAQGLASLERWESVSAVSLLGEAVEREPDNPLIHAALAEAWGLLDDTQNHVASAQRAFELSGGLSRQRQLEIEARYRLANSQWERAQELYRALFEFYPQNLEYGLSLARALDKGARYADALATLSTLEDLPGPMGADPRIDLTEAWVHYHTGDWEDALAAGQAAAAKAQRINARSLWADALLMQVMTASASDTQTDLVDGWLRQADTLFEQVGNPRGRARVQQNLGNQAFRAGRYQAAEDHYREGISLARASGNQATLAKGETSLAIVFDVSGRLQEGLALKHEVLENYRSRNVRQGQAITLENIGISLWKLGQLDDAMTYFKEAESEMREIGDETGLALAPYYQGRVWYGLGRLEIALARFKQAALEAQKHPQGSLGPYTEFEIARVDIAAGRFEQAERSLLSLLSLFQDSGQSIDEGDTARLLAKLYLARGDWSSARRYARDALTIFEPEVVRYYEVDARAALTASLIRDQSAALADQEEQCGLLGAEVQGLEHKSVALLGQVVVAECQVRLVGADVTASLSRIEGEATALGLFEAWLSAARTKVHALRKLGRDSEAAVVWDKVKSAAAQNQWWLSDSPA